MSGEWKAPLTLRRIARLAPASLHSTIARSTPRLFAADHDLPGTVVVRRHDEAGLARRLRADLLDRDGCVSPRIAAMAPGRFDAALVHQLAAPPHDANARPRAEATRRRDTP